VKKLLRLGRGGDERHAPGSFLSLQLGMDCWDGRSAETGGPNQVFSTPRHLRAGYGAA
jgi:hypothetical protein